MPKLTKKVVESITPSEKETWLWDSELEGFGVRTQPTGRKTYIVRYRVKNASKTQRKQTIARCSDIAPDKAREMARKIFAQVAEGKDPVGDKKTETLAPTITELMQRYNKEHAKPFKKEASAALDEKNWRLHIIPFIGGKKIKEVGRADILKLHGSLSEMPATANQVIALLSKAFNLAEDWEWRDRNTNPCHKIKKYDINQRELILTQEQIFNLSQSLDFLSESKKISTPMANLVRLLMVTGCRLREIMHAKTSWIDKERNLLLLPDSKVGKRNIALSPTAMAIILEIMKTGQEWLIPSTNPKQPMTTPYKYWEAIKKHAELPNELRIHDLRHTAGSLGHLAGMSQKEIQIMLGHKQMSTTERYLHGAAGGDAAIADKLSNVIVGAWAKKAA